MKRIKLTVLLLWIAAVLVMMTGCGKKKETENTLTKENIASLAEGIAGDVQYLSDMSDPDIDAQIEMYTSQSTGDESTKAMAEGLKQFKEARKESGSYEGIYKDEDGNVKFTCQQDSDSVIVKISAKFTKRDIDVSYTISMKDGSSAITQVMYEPQYTLGEKMKKAGMNTVIGIMIVIVMLIFLSLIISLFGYINRFERYLTHRKQARFVKEEENAGNEIIESRIAPDEDEEIIDETDDTELVAVITAAIMAAGGTVSQDGFVVRSIKRVPNSRWNRA